MIKKRICIVNQLMNKRIMMKMTESKEKMKNKIKLMIRIKITMRIKDSKIVNKLQRIRIKRLERMKR